VDVTTDASGNPWLCLYNVLTSSQISSCYGLPGATAAEDTWQMVEVELTDNTSAGTGVASPKPDDIYTNAEDSTAGLSTMPIMGGGQVAWNKDSGAGFYCATSSGASCPSLYYTSYNDMVKKVYQHYARPERIEIWNEPDQCPVAPNVCWYMPPSQ
jgi:hypothetical protein